MCPRPQLSHGARWHNRTSSHIEQLARVLDAKPEAKTKTEANKKSNSLSFSLLSSRRRRASGKFAKDTRTLPATEVDSTVVALEPNAHSPISKLGPEQARRKRFMDNLARLESATQDRVDSLAREHETTLTQLHVHGFERAALSSTKRQPEDTTVTTRKRPKTQIDNS